VIDLHAHPLPGLDDGPDTVDKALALAAAAAAGGTRVMAATPHIDFSWSIDPATVPGLVQAQNERIAGAGIELRLVPGGEVAASRLEELDGVARAAVRLGGGPYLLVECPHFETGAAFGMMIFEALTQGEQIMLAHPERSPAFANDLETLARLMASGVLCSITASSLNGRFGGAARRLAFEMLGYGLVHSIDSDAHDTEGRPPSLLHAVQEADHDLPGLADQAHWYLQDAPAAILAGTPLPPRPEPPAPPAKRGMLARLGLRRA
jgi:protein-tyrosine phosphatase